MIVSGDIATIFQSLVSELGLPVYIRGSIPQGELTQERVHILPEKVSEEKIWNKCFVKVNICVPDIENNANLIRLQELERAGRALLSSGVGTYDGTKYRYSRYEVSGSMEDAPMRCHFVSIMVLFEFLNTLKNK